MDRQALNQGLNVTRNHIPHSTQTDLFTHSMRRCAICFGVQNDFAEKPGQIAHINHDNSQTALDDLVWLCAFHHDKYDSKTSQTKNYTKQEVISYRARLYQAVEEYRKANSHLNDNKEKDETCRTLSIVFGYMPFTHLLDYIHDFPEFFPTQILEPSERWSDFKRSNPHIYPFSDQNLNIHIDRFFSICEKLNTHLTSFIEGEAHYQSSVDYNGTNHKLGLNKDLDHKKTTKVLKAANAIKHEYSIAYNNLVSYLRSSYPKASLNGYHQ